MLYFPSSFVHRYYKGLVTEQLNGTFELEHQVVIGFPTKAQALDWYHLKDYQSLITLRNDALDSQFQLIG